MVIMRRPFSVSSCSSGNYIGHFSEVSLIWILNEMHQRSVLHWGRITNDVTNWRLSPLRTNELNLQRTHSFRCGETLTKQFSYSELDNSHDFPRWNPYPSFFVMSAWKKKNTWTDCDSVYGGLIWLIWFILPNIHFSRLSTVIARKHDSRPY